jgi:hypothetical protein
MKTESKIQQEIVMFYRNKYCTMKNNPRHLIFSVPNEGKDLHEQMAKKATGLLSGVSDLIIVRPNETLFVEVKDDKGRQKKEQIDFQAAIESLGMKYFLVRSKEEFINKVIYGKD